MAIGDPVARAQVRHSAQSRAARQRRGPMGSSWCSHRRPEQCHGDGGTAEYYCGEAGRPSPGCPKVDSQGRRLIVSPSSGRCRAAQRTPSEDLPDLPKVW